MITDPGARRNMQTKAAEQDPLKGYPHEIILKDGTGVTLRCLRQGDEEALAEMFRHFSADELWFLNDDVTEPAVIRNWVRHLDPVRIVSIVACLEGRIIGNAALMRKRFGAKSHIGKIRIMVDPAFRERRLGTWMLLDLINLGMSMGLKALVIRLVPDRDLMVIDGVRKLDFQEKAVLKDYVLDRSGQAHDLLIMMKHLPSRWNPF